MKTYNKSSPTLLLYLYSFTSLITLSSSRQMVKRVNPAPLETGPSDLLESDWNLEDYHCHKSGSEGVAELMIPPAMKYCDMLSQFQDFVFIPIANFHYEYRTNDAGFSLATKHRLRDMNSKTIRLEARFDQIDGPALDSQPQGASLLPLCQAVVYAIFRTKCVGDLKTQGGWARVKRDMALNSFLFSFDLQDYPVESVVGREDRDQEVPEQAASFPCYFYNRRCDSRRVSLDPSDIHVGDDAWCKAEFPKHCHDDH